MENHVIKHHFILNTEILLFFQIPLTAVDSTYGDSVNYLVFTNIGIISLSYLWNCKCDKFLCFIIFCFLELISGLKQNMSNIQRLSRFSSLPNLQEDNIDLKVKKMRAISSSENVSKLIPIVKFKAELDSYRKKTMQERLNDAAPYNLFFNVLEIAPETYKQPNAIKFTGNRYFFLYLYISKVNMFFFRSSLSQFGKA